MSKPAGAQDRPGENAEYAPAPHTATVGDADALYVVDFRSSRVLRLAGVAAIAWECASGLLSREDLDALLAEAETAEHAEQVAAGIRASRDALQAHGLLVTKARLGPTALAGAASPATPDLPNP